MKIKADGKSLESYKIFPYIAWVLVIGFATFVYNIAMTLQDVANDLERQTSYIEKQIDAIQNDFSNANLDNKASTTTGKH